MIEKFHHKLFILNRFLQRDLSQAHQQSRDRNSLVRRAVKVLGNSLDDQHKARQMKNLVDSVRNFYQDPGHEYPLKVALFVGAHKILAPGDYLKLRQTMLE